MVVKRDVKILELLDEKSGQSQKGDWLYGEYKLQDMADQSMFVAKAWNKDSEECKESVGCIVSVEVKIQCRQFNNKWFNDVLLSNIVNKDKKQISEDPSVVSNTKVEEIDWGTKYKEDDLPF
jgi:Protein of unknown function (DUF3127).